MKLVEKVGEVAQVLNIQNGRKSSDINPTEALAEELSDIIYYSIAIVAINNIDLESAFLEKYEKAPLKYERTNNLFNHLEKTK